jgi:2-polyprenyl-6-methoxyphenol hydroxylase-like FAD-dependent oxidoreductase
MPRSTVLISGAGIAGPTLAWWLARYGFAPTIVERAPTLRTGGYVVDFWGAGYDIAGRMGLLPEVRARGYAIREVRNVDARGRIIGAFDATSFGRAARSGFTTVGRSELSRIVFDSLPAGVETLFGDSITSMDETDRGVDVAFERHPPRTFDLVVGADGLLSRVRELWFGDESDFERYLGMKVAACVLPGYRPRDELVYMMYPTLGQQIARFSMRDDITMALFTFADPDPAIPYDPAGQKAALTDRFGGTGWEADAILGAMEASSDLYFDRVSQIDMREAGGWSKGRVTLIGDAAFCVSLLGGQGSALAMTAGYILAGELHRHGQDYRAAFAAYERLFGAFVAGKQRAARNFAGTFAPRSRFSLWLRNRLFGLMSIPLVAHLVVGRAFMDKLKLPDYERE